METATLDLRAQPLTLVSFTNVRDLEADPRRIELTQPRDDIRGASTGRAKSDPGYAVQFVLAESVKLRRQLRRAFGRRTQRVEWNRHVAIAANRVNKLGSGGDIAKKSGIEFSRCGSTNARGRRRRAGNTFRESEKLTPRFVYRRWITPIGFVRLGD